SNHQALFVRSLPVAGVSHGRQEVRAGDDADGPSPLVRHDDTVDVSVDHHPGQGADGSGRTDGDRVGGHEPAHRVRPELVRAHPLSACFAPTHHPPTERSPAARLTTRPPPPRPTPPSPLGSPTPEAARAGAFPPARQTPGVSLESAAKPGAGGSRVGIPAPAV